MSALDIVSLIFPLAICGSAVVLNFLSMSAILGFAALRKQQNIFAFHLSLCDFIGAMGIVMTYVPRLIKGLTPTPWTELLFATALIVSILTTLAIAVERFVVFRVDPFGNRDIITPCRSIMVCLCSWLLVFVLYYLFVKFEEYIKTILARLTLTIVLWSTMLVTATCYGFIYQRISSTSRNVGQSDRFLQQRIKVHQKIVLTFGLVVGSTCLCWVPMSVVEILEGLQLYGDRGWFVHMDRVSFNILCLSPVLNPIIIWSRLTEFRNQLPVCFGGGLGGTEQETKTPVTPTISLSLRIKDKGIATSP
ncbi:uncharacterized protein LOC105443257 [Strongylocentrotus purpuratus]|uniref:G-protein coupled receptors family 1 profile domain-containing protein n=1 Tax=Strongylocentrotus purpuratus TaxID=7668 RepID=A0A7M7HNA4_STRPU|nr:uncharacterized protein LOC105443257 [Strongylocentrotus purpuratus]|eukprot:XP_011674526.1 PREDICTED: uncharacterized protein LOC105443257 [Strongylocentrotus purpuratus]